MEDKSDMDVYVFPTCCDLGRKQSTTSADSSSGVSTDPVSQRTHKPGESQSSRSRKPKKSPRKPRAAERDPHTKNLTKEDEEHINREFELWTKYKEWQKNSTKERQVEMTTMKFEGFTISVPLRPLSPCSSLSSVSSDSSLEWDPERYLRVMSVGYGTPNWGEVCVKRMSKFPRQHDKTKKKGKRNVSSASLDRKSSETGMPGYSFSNIPGFNVPGFGGRPGEKRPWFWSPSISSLSILSPSESAASLSENEASPEHGLMLSASIGSCTSLFSETKFPQWISLDDEVEDREEIQLWPEQMLLALYYRGSSTREKGEAAQELSDSSSDVKLSEASSIRQEKPRDQSEIPAETMASLGEATAAESSSSSASALASWDVETALEQRIASLCDFDDEDDDNTHLSDSSSARHEYKWIPMEEGRKDFWQTNYEPAHSGYSSSGSCDSELDRCSFALSDALSAERRSPTPHAEERHSVAVDAPEREFSGRRPTLSSTPLDNINSFYRAEVRRLRAIGHGMDPGTTDPSKTRIGEATAEEATGPHELTEADIKKRFIEEVANEFLEPGRRTYIDLFQGDRNAVLRTAMGKLLVVDLEVLKGLDLYALHMEAIGERNFQKMIHQLPPVRLSNVIRVLLWASYFQARAQKPSDPPSESSQEELSSGSDALSSSEGYTSLSAPATGEESTADLDSSDEEEGSLTLLEKHERRRRKPRDVSKQHLTSPASSQTSSRSTRSTQTSSKGSKRVAKIPHLSDLEDDPQKLAVVEAIAAGLSVGDITRLTYVADYLGARDFQTTLLRLLGRSLAGRKDLKNIIDYKQEGAWLPKLIARLKEQIPDDHCIVPYADDYALDIIGSLKGLTSRSSTSKGASIDIMEQVQSQISLPSFTLILEPEQEKKTEAQSRTETVHKVSSLEKTGSREEMQDSAKTGKQSSLQRKGDEKGKTQPSRSRRISIGKKADKRYQPTGGSSTAQKAGKGGQEIKGKRKSSSLRTGKKQQTRRRSSSRRSSKAMRTSGGKRPKKSSQRQSGRDELAEGSHPQGDEAAAPPIGKKLFVPQPVSAVSADRIGGETFGLQPASSTTTQPVESVDTSAQQVDDRKSVDKLEQRDGANDSADTDKSALLPDGVGKGDVGQSTNDQPDSGQYSQGGQEPGSKQYPYGVKQIDNRQHPFGSREIESGRKPYGDGERDSRSKVYGDKKPDSGRKPYGERKPDIGRKPYGEQQSQSGRVPNGVQQSESKQYPLGHHPSPRGQFPYSTRKPGSGTVGDQLSESGQSSYGESESGEYSYSDEQSESLSKQHSRGDQYTNGEQQPERGGYPLDYRPSESGRSQFKSQIPYKRQYQMVRAPPDSAGYHYDGPDTEKYDSSLHSPDRRQYPSDTLRQQYSGEYSHGSRNVDQHTEYETGSQLSSQDTRFDTSRPDRIQRISKSPYAVKPVKMTFGRLLETVPQGFGSDQYRSGQRRRQTASDEGRRASATADDSGRETTSTRSRKERGTVGTEQVKIRGEQEKDEDGIDDYDTFSRKHRCAYECPKLSDFPCRKGARGRRDRGDKQNNRYDPVKGEEQRSKIYWSDLRRLQQGASPASKHYGGTNPILREAIDCRVGEIFNDIEGKFIENK